MQENSPKQHGKKLISEQWFEAKKKQKTKQNNYKKKHKKTQTNNENQCLNQEREHVIRKQLSRKISSCI